MTPREGFWMIELSKIRPKSRAKDPFNFDTDPNPGYFFKINDFNQKQNFQIIFFLLIFYAKTLNHSEFMKFS